MPLGGGSCAGRFNQNGSHIAPTLDQGAGTGEFHARALVNIQHSVGRAGNAGSMLQDAAAVKIGRPTPPDRCREKCLQGGVAPPGVSKPRAGWQAVVTCVRSTPRCRRRSVRGRRGTHAGISRSGICPPSSPPSSSCSSPPPLLPRHDPPRITTSPSPLPLDPPRLVCPDGLPACPASDHKSPDLLMVTRAPCRTSVAAFALERDQGQGCRWPTGLV